MIHCFACNENLMRRGINSQAPFHKTRHPKGAGFNEMAPDAIKRHYAWHIEIILTLDSVGINRIKIFSIHIPKLFGRHIKKREPLKEEFAFIAKQGSEA